MERKENNLLPKSQQSVMQTEREWDGAAQEGSTQQTVIENERMKR